MRLFIAIDLPDTILDQLQPLWQSRPTGRPGVLEQIHLTLSFLGEVPPRGEAGITEALSGIRSRHFPLKVEGVGCFPSAHRARILWAGISASPGLQSLKKQIDEALRPLGFIPDKKPFHPHLTLARIRNPRIRGIAEFLQRYREFSSEEFVVEDFHLYSSQLTPKGALYKKFKSFSLTTLSPTGGEGKGEGDVE